MPPGILRGSRTHCLEGLREDRVDLSEYPLHMYADLDTFRVLEQEVHIFQGVNTVPHDRYIISLDEPAALNAGLNVPGVVPFLASTFQVSANRRISSPRPTEVGLPLLTTETKYLIRWMFGLDGDRHAGHTLWRRLSTEELESLPDAVRPDEHIKPDARANYEVSGAFAAPEPTEFVRPRIGGLPYEPWLARSVDLAQSWRVVVPNTSISCRPVIIPPKLTIVGQNFNVLLCPSAEIAIAVGAVLSRSEPLGYLIGISPWAQGDTPRPRSKHVNATLWSFQEHIDSLLTDEAETISLLAGDFEEVWKLHLAAAISFARGQHADGQPLRGRYKAIEPRDSINQVPVSLEGLDDNVLTLGTSDGVVRVEFSTPEEAALATVASWTVIPRSLPIGGMLALRFPPDSCQSPVSVRRLLIEKRWAALVGEQVESSIDQIDENDEDEE